MDFSDNTIKKSKRKENMFCSNCGKIGHTYKFCYGPITSCGIICINFKQSKSELINFFSKKYKFSSNMNEQTHSISIHDYIKKNINCKGNRDVPFYIDKVINNSDFLLVRRKQSFNYISLIRGQYELEIEPIIKSINNLTHTEYENINTKEFDDLWNEIFGIYTKTNTIDYDQSKEKFIFLKTYIIPQIRHRINIQYDYPEWGFPKGRRTGLESDIDCATREFEEETGLKKNNYTILNRIQPLSENLCGTNGIHYRYLYFIAVMNSDKIIKLDQTDSQKFEIGDIGFYCPETSKNKFREYNTERKEVINNVKLFLTYNIRFYEKYYNEKK